jgi:hypothetical protein
MQVSWPGWITEELTCSSVQARVAAYACWRQGCEDSWLYGAIRGGRGSDVAAQGSEECGVQAESLRGAVCVSDV